MHMCPPPQVTMAKLEKMEGLRVTVQDLPPLVFNMLQASGRNQDDSVK